MNTTTKIAISKKLQPGILLGHMTNSNSNYLQKCSELSKSPFCKFYQNLSSGGECQRLFMFLLGK